MQIEIEKYDHGDRNEVAEFVGATTGKAFMGERARELLTSIITDRERVCRLFSKGRMVGTGILLDNCQNQTNDAELSIIVENNAPLLQSLVLAWSIPLVVAGPREGIALSEFPGLKFQPGWLKENGFSLGYRMWEMELRKERAGQVPVLSDEFRWKNFSPEHSDALYEVLREAFAEIPGAFVPEKEIVMKRYANCSPLPQLLFHRESLVGFVRVGLLEGTRGEIAILGRHRSWRGKKMGEQLVARGIEVLKKNGATHIQLEVAASNERALGLYRSFGFEPVSSMNVYRRTF